MFYVSLVLLLAIGGEYLYFSQKMDIQRKQILVLNRHNENLKSRVNKQQSSPLSSVNVKYTDPTYKSAYTTDNSILYLSPLEDSPIIFKIQKSLKVSLLDCVEVLNLKWYEVNIPSLNGQRLKGWLKESEIKMMVEEATL